MMRLPVILFVVLLAAAASAAGPEAEPEGWVKIEMRNNTRFIFSNGLPDHDHGRFPNRHNPNSISPQRYKFRMPLHPETAGKVTPLGRAPFGMALNGVPFDPGTAEYWNHDPQSGWRYEALSGKTDLGLDASNAHVQPSGAYHYHGLPLAMMKRSVGEQMLLVGYAADGFPIYATYGHSRTDDASSPLQPMRSSYRLKEGSRTGGPGGRHDGTFVQDWKYVSGSGDLDECNARFGVTPEYPEGTHHYFITEQFPFVPRCYLGLPDDSFLRRGAFPHRGERPPRRPVERPSSPHPPVDGPAAPGDVAPAPAAVNGPAAADIIASLQQSLPFIETDGVAWMEGRAPFQSNVCASCHHVPFLLWVHAEAGRAGLSIDREKLRQWTEWTLDFCRDSRDSDDKLDGGGLDAMSPVLLARESGGVTQRVTDYVELAEVMAARQQPEGHWQAEGQFFAQDRPRKETDLVSTMWAVLALGSVDEPGEEIQAARQRAVERLARGDRGTTTEFQAAGLLVAHALGDTDGVAQRQDSLLGLQHDDGGWSWKPENPSDAFATGQSLYALATTGGDALAIATAQRFLLDSQGQDGTWSVPSSRFSTRADESHDSIYHYWSTAWAALGLARSLEAGETEPGRTAEGSR